MEGTQKCRKHIRDYFDQVFTSVITAELIGLYRLICQKACKYDTLVITAKAITFTVLLIRKKINGTY